MRLVSAAATSLLLFAFARGQPEPFERIVLPENEPWVHEPSGFRFPPDVGTFTRVNALRYDDDGRDVSVGYNDRALKTILTVYVYPHDGDTVEAEFAKTKGSVRQVHPRAKALADGKWDLTQGRRKFTGRRAAFEFTVKAADRQQEVVSEACLLRVGDYFVKFRMTCPKDKHEPASDRATRFMQSLKLPDAVGAAK